ncbi:MAG: efflux RND transporter periplasmic adaptor subunit [Acidobacteria bacterium]|nr:efflux RND transporter periplasmic adaptor subunit [Acidobacteriota bacterium]
MKRHSLLFLPVLFIAGCGSHPEEAPPKLIVEVKVAKAESAEVRVTVRGPAFVFAREQANIGARFTAPIRKLLARKGDNVSAGQVLAQLDNRDLLAQRDEAAAAVTDAEANLQRVTSGTLPTDIERARGQAAGAEAALNQAQKFYDRRRQLFEQGAIPQRDLLLSETELTQAKANHEVAKRSLDLLQNQSRDKEILMAKSKVEQAQARLALIKAQVDFAEIRSTSAGTITEQFMFPGDMAKPDAPIFTVMDLAVAVARVQIPEAEAAAVRSGAACTFVPADAAGTSFAGRISVVNQAVDPARRTVECWCEIPNSKRALRAGAFGQAAIVTGIAPDSIVVPVAAVQFVEGTPKGVVMVAGAKGLAVKKEVETGDIFDGKVQIRTGLNAGDSVIVQGAYGLAEGTQVRVQGGKKQ